MEKQGIQIPKANDDEWQREMLRQLWDSLSDVDVHGEGNEQFARALTEAMEICEALQEYSGY